MALAEAARTWIEAARIAVGIDVAGVEFGALVLVAEHVIGGGNFLEALLGLGVARMGVGMMLLGEVAEGLFDFGFAGGLGHAQDFIGIVHTGLSGRNSPYWLHYTIISRAWLGQDLCQPAKAQ